MPPTIDEAMCKQEQWQSLKFSMQFIVNIISNTKFSEKLSDEELLKAFNDRFDGNVPLKFVDCVFVHSLNPKELDESLGQDGLNEGSVDRESGLKA